MFSPNTTAVASDSTVLQYAIQHDIEDIDDLDEFLTEDPEECVHAMLCNAGCFY